MKTVISKNLIPSTSQLIRLVILAGILLVLVVVGFGGYYYYDRFYSNEQPMMEKMIQQAEIAVAKDPQDVEKRLDLAELYLANRRFEEGLKLAGQATVQEPENQRAWLVLGVGFYYNGEPAAAVQPLTKYVDANKNAEMPHLNKPLQSAAYYLGDSYLALNQPDRAVEPLTMAVVWSQTDADAMYKLGLALIGTHQYDQAMAVLEKAVRLVPDYIEVYEAMASIYDYTNQPDLRKYADGMVAYCEKDYPLAQSLLSEVTQKQAQFTPALVGLGMVYEAQENQTGAMVAYKAALALDPTNFTASNGVSRLEALLNK